MANKVHIVFLLIIFSLLLISKISFSQNGEIQFEHISIEQGLSSSLVNCLLQDSSGFLWIGTRDGLNKYDGYDFTTYHYDPGKHNSLSNNNVTSIYIDKTGVLWIGTKEGGLNKFNKATGTFKHYKHNTNDPNNLSHNFVTCISEDNTGGLWIGTLGGGINHFNSARDTIAHYKHDLNNPNSLNDNESWSIYY